MDSEGQLRQLMHEVVSFVHGWSVVGYLHLRHSTPLKELHPLASRIERELAPRREAEEVLFNVILVSGTGLSMNDVEADTELVSGCPLLFQKITQLGI